MVFIVQSNSNANRHVDCTEADRKTPRQTERKSRNTDTKTAYGETDRQGRNTDTQKQKSYTETDRQTHRAET